ncbi:MAG: transcriptional repressor LexA [Coriobacteriia bacterium]|jgi:repressor LexA|nr:transcriptional repressor LexA [Coriobacteriia bacterium]MDR2713961.1 transcriptional repressor LexA [Coriobacteriales bacterium]
MSSNENLTKRQQEVLAFLKRSSAKNGYPPSVREIGAAVGLSSSSTVHAHLRSLENKRLIKRDPTSARAIVILDDEPVADENAGAAERLHELERSTVRLPVVGNVAAGTPIYADENVEETLTLPTQVVGDTGSFMLTIKGESMIEAGIMDGDYIVVREQPTADNGDIVVALLEDEATVKTFYRESDCIRLQPENPSMDPIYTTDAIILGKVVALLRTL